MITKIPLRLDGIDLRTADIEATSDPDLEDLFFESNGGISVAVVYTEDPDPVKVALDASHRISKLMNGVSVRRVHDELVSTADIAARCEVAPEAVRLWAAGRRRTQGSAFPPPRQVVGSGSGGRTMSLYAWRDVLEWVREVVGLDPDEDISYLDESRLAQLDAELCADQRWGGGPWTDAMTKRFDTSNAIEGVAVVDATPYTATVVSLANWGSLNIRESTREDDAVTSGRSVRAVM